MKSTERCADEGGSSGPEVIQILESAAALLICFVVATWMLVASLSSCHYVFHLNLPPDFAKLADGYLNDIWFQYNPAHGTPAGFHECDGTMPTFSRAEFHALAA